MKPKPVSSIESTPVEPEGLIEEIVRVNGDKEFEMVERDKPISFDRVLSTGSTLLDLSICGERIRGGGVPGGIFMEIFGPESVGKTAILAELISSTQNRISQGQASLQDPEGRFGAEHARIYSMDLPSCEYSRPDTVEEMFDTYYKWKPEGDGIHVFATDSLAALSTKLEMESEDKWGLRRAKMFSEGLRKSARRVANEDHLFVYTNQIRESVDNSYRKTTTPGGRAIRFYASVRLEMVKPMKWRIDRMAKLPSGKEAKQQVGIITEVQVIKNSVAQPFRSALIHIQLGYGIDDITANLQWLKDTTGDTSFGWDKSTKSQSLRGAVTKVEGDRHDPATWKEAVLQDRVIDLWMEIQEKFADDRRPKLR